MIKVNRIPACIHNHNHTHIHIHQGIRQKEYEKENDIHVMIEALYTKKQGKEESRNARVLMILYLLRKRGWIFHLIKSSIGLGLLLSRLGCGFWCLNRCFFLLGGCNWLISGLLCGTLALSRWAGFLLGRNDRSG